jgi:hypothetical protein
VSSIAVEGNALRLDGKRVPLLAAQFDFYRHLPMFWRPILRHIKETGFPIVSTFVCWDFHELEPGTYDFSGQTESARNLHAFIRLCAEEGLLVFLRPGPIIDDEWPTRGPAPDVCTLERTDPRFRARAADWMAAVAEVIREHQYTNGGPVVLVQLDNEVFYPHCTEGSATEADASYHIPYHADQVLGDFRNWLGADPAPHRAGPGSATGVIELQAAEVSRHPLPSTSTSFRFISDTISSYHAWVRDLLRSSGVEVPVIANIKHGLAYMNWSELRQDVDLLGCNNYLDNPRSGQEYLNLTWWYGLQRGRLGNVLAPEFWCGSWIEIGQDTRIFEPHHYQYVLMTGIAHGLRAANFFMFVERDDWHFSPITAIGKTRPNLLQPFRTALPLLARLRDDRRLARIGLLWSKEHHQAFLAERHPDVTTLATVWWEDDQPKEFPAWWHSLERLVEEDWDFDIVDADRASLADYDAVIYAGPDAAPPAMVADLAAYAANGGKVVVSGDLPITGLHGNPLKAAPEVARHAISATPHNLGDTLRGLGIGNYAQADRPGCNTFAYVSDDYVAVFACNTTQRPMPVRVRLSDALVALVGPAAGSEVGGRGETGSEIGFQLDPYTVDVRIFDRA